MDVETEADLRGNGGTSCTRINWGGRSMPKIGINGGKKAIKNTKVVFKIFPASTLLSGPS